MSQKRYVLVPVKPEIGMVEAGYEASLGMPDRSRHAMVIEMYEAMLAAAPQPEHGERELPDYLADALDNLVHDNYELSQCGWRNRQADAGLIRAALTARPAQPEHGERPDEVHRLREALQQCITSMLDSGYRRDSVVIRCAEAALSAQGEVGA